MYVCVRVHAAAALILLSGVTQSDGFSGMDDELETERSWTFSLTVCALVFECVKDMLYSIIQAQADNVCWLQSCAVIGPDSGLHGSIGHESCREAVRQVLDRMTVVVCDTLPSHANNNSWVDCSAMKTPELPCLHCCTFKQDHVSHPASNKILLF